MPELITEEQPRVKFACHRDGTFCLARCTQDLLLLTQLMQRMEALGAAPILNDGLVGGNCAVRRSLADAQAGPQDTTLLVSRSGKAAGAALQLQDWVRVTRFDRGAWAADFESSAPGVRPSSDTPLLQACLLGSQCLEAYGWGAAPCAALHGHALAEGTGLEAALRQGLPVSDAETLFSTPADLEALEALFRAYPYPAHKLYIRRGHGFFLLGATVEELQRGLEEMVAPISLEG